MNTKPGDFFLYYKAKTAAYPGEGASWALEPNWWDQLKGFFNPAETPVASQAPPPLPSPNTGSVSQRLFRSQFQGPLTPPAQSGLAPRISRGLIKSPAAVAAPAEAGSAYSAANAMQQGMKPPGVLRSGLNLAKGGLGFLGRSLATGAVSTASDAVSRGAVGRLTGSNEAVDEGPVGNAASRAVKFVAPFLPLGSGAALSTVPAIGRTLGAVAGNMVGPESEPVQFGPAAERHQGIKERAMSPTPTTQADLEAMHRKDPFSVSFGPGGKIEGGPDFTGKTEYRLNKPSPLK